MRFVFLALLILALPAQALAQAVTSATVPNAVTQATAGPAPLAVTAVTESVAAPADDAAVIARLNDIQATLEARRKHADYWFYGWLSFYAATAVGQAVIGYFEDSEKLRAANYIGAATSVLGVSGMLISPIPTGRVADDAAALPKGTAEERRASLEEAERILAKTQEAEVKGRHWTEHALGALVSGGAAAIVYFVYDDWEQALLKVGSGILFGQTRPLTGPIAHHDFWPSYQPAASLPGSVTGLDSLRIIPTPKGVLATMNF